MVSSDLDTPLCVYTTFDFDPRNWWLNVKRPWLNPIRLEGPTNSPTPPYECAHPTIVRGLHTCPMLLHCISGKEIHLT